ncbi:Calcium and integrin-binding protein 1 [Microtus ochrogaster]|uniref:Calcium and integrin-binding protein 1 n=1 Tax=Microtus ochrogaster TaxID=79684 RepID=A0A8J6G7S6_MICOH|nr:Calcium and integrin-binding protein 1 [Microtus ochrogaster]
MGGSGSRLSKELLAEYQVRGASILAELACGPAPGSGVREPAAGQLWLSGGLLTLVWICLSGPDVPDQAGDPSANPFKERICMVFSTSPNRDSLSFEDFLDLLSVFSDTATPDIKSHYAFRIFDFDDDGTLDREDLSRLVNCLTGEGEDTRLTASEMKQLIDNILEESDIDRDGTINLSEFQHVISRSPDFARCDRSSPAF